MPHDLVIIGAGGHGRVVLDILQCQAKYTPIAFLDADVSQVGSNIMGVPVLGPINMLAKLKKQGVTHAIIAIGDNRVRASYAQIVLQSTLQLANAIHPSAVISNSAQLADNLVIAANAVIGPQAKIAQSTIINTSSVVEHECELADAVHLCPGALLAGRVRVGHAAFIGIGARVIPCLQIGHHAIVGAGAVVTTDVPNNATVVGIPARLIKLTDPREP